MYCSRLSHFLVRSLCALVFPYHQSFFSEIGVVGLGLLWIYLIIKAIILNLFWGLREDDNACHMVHSYTGLICCILVE
ncbi:hypothetical protein BDV29DRAFT_103092 [Aspergillus leporis]|jgi:hypothetical protein|uniref:Uncharacterized protein n=1 Tax=Aspergillus leporis TaxID=41062 RepID=A0A5N5X6I9_9EURO|nr:hypothetical protein BDV29DRAFT_103092 [Aspergillus leporis]